MLYKYSRQIEKTSAVIIGLGTNGLSVARSLGKKDVPLTILEEKKKYKQVHLKTKYGQKVLLDSLIGKDLINYLRSVKTPFVLFPTTDRQVKWISSNRYLLPERCKLSFPKSEIVDLLLDKKIFFNFCSENGFTISPYNIIEKHDDIIKATQTLRFPLIIKTSSKKYIKGLAKAYIIRSKNELLDIWNTLRKLSEKYIAQEYIEGEDTDIYFCLQYINRHGELKASFTGQKIRQWKPLCGGTSSCHPAETPQLHRITYEIFKKAGFWGLGSIEYKKDKRDGKFYIIEPTVCRTDFQQQIAEANGVNIPYISYQDANGYKVKKSIVSGGNIAWMHLLHDRCSAEYYINQGQFTFWQWIYSLRKVRSFDLLSINDPLPSLTSIYYRLKRKG